MTEEAPRGERLFPAISLSLFLTTRLPQQMAPALTQRDAAKLRGAAARAARTRELYYLRDGKCVYNFGEIKANMHRSSCLLY